MHLLLIRHGQSYVNVDGWDGGWIDTGLTKLGQQQAVRLAEWLVKHARLDVIYSSTMARALETATYLTQATGLTARLDDRLREFGHCYADGTPVPPDEMPIQYGDFWGTMRPYTRINETGESWLLFRVRVGNFLDEIVQRYKKEDPNFTIAVVCHNGIVEASCDTLFNVGVERRAQIHIHHTGIVHWEYSPESGQEPWCLHAHGLAQHLVTRDGDWLGSAPLLRDAERTGKRAKNDLQ